MTYPIRKMICLASIFFAMIMITQCARKNLTAPPLPPDDQDDTASIIHDTINKWYQTVHFRIHYPSAGDSTIAREMAQYAESVYNYVDGIYCGNSPETATQVYLSGERGNYYFFGGTKPDGIYLYIQNGNNMKQIFAHEFGHVTFWDITQKRAYQFDFINEGASVIIEKHYEEEAGFVEPWDDRAYWASQQGFYTKANLSDLHPSDLGSVGYAVGYSFVSYLRGQYGAEKMVELIINLPDNTLSSAFQRVSLDYDAFYDGWMALLTDRYNLDASRLDLVPIIQDSLMIEAHEDGTRDVRVRINVHNGETSRYNVFFSYYINDIHSEPEFDAYTADFETVAVIGLNLDPGTNILYDIVVNSNVLKAWIKSGWKRLTL